MALETRDLQSFDFGEKLAKIKKKELVATNNYIFQNWELRILRPKFWSLNQTVSFGELATTF